VLPKSYIEVRILENSQIFDWELSGEDYEKIATIETKRRHYQAPCWKVEAKKDCGM
jgi:diketogulonate reductase-like aldo/keto reductase